MKHIVLLALLAAAAFAGPAKPHYPMLSPAGAGLLPGPIQSVETDPRILAIRVQQEAAIERGDRAELKRLEAEVQAILLSRQASPAAPGLVLERFAPSGQAPAFAGPDAVIDTGFFGATAADYLADGTMYVAGFRLSDTIIWFYRSTDDGLTWEGLYGYAYSVGGRRVMLDKLVLCAGEGDSAFLHLFLNFRPPHNDLYLLRAAMDAGGGQTFVITGPADTVSDFTACRDYTGSNYWLYAMAIRRDPSNSGNGLYARSTNYGRTWAVTDTGNWCSEPHYAFGDGSWLYHALPADNGQVYLFFNRVFGAGGLWAYQIVWPDTFEVEGPVIAPAFTLPESTAAVWTLFSHDYEGTGDWDIICAWSTSGGRSWVDWDYLAGDFDSLERFADLRNYASPGNGYVNGSYVWESDRRNVFRHFSNSGDPGNWSDTVRINTTSAGTGSRVRPLLVYSPGGPGSGAGCVFVGAGLRDLYFNSPWLTALHEAGRGPFERTRAATFCAGVLDLAPAISSPASGHALYDAAGRRVVALRPGPTDLGRLPAGVYHLVAGDGAALRRVVLVR
jgi:hypothetical protein